MRPYTKVSLRSWSTTLKSSVRALRIHQLQPPALEPEEEREPHLENFDANIHTSADVVAPICKAELRLRRYRTNGTPLALLTDLQPVRGQYHVTIQNAVPISFNHNDEYCLWRNQLVTLFGVTAMLDLVQPQPPQVFAGPPTEPMPILGTSSVLPRGSPRLSEAFGIAFQELYQEHGYLPSEEIPVHWDRSWVAAVAEGLPLQDAHLYSGPLCREQGILPSASKVFTGYVHERAPGPNGARYEVNGRPTALHSGVEGLPVLYARYPVRAIIAAVLCL